MKTDNSYLQVDPDFYNVLQTFMKKDIKVIYFGFNNILEESKGFVKNILRKENGEFLNIKNGNEVRLDKIITINGRPGPAFDEYDAYANECLSCQAGYDD